MRAKVPALPNQVTSMRLAPMRGEARSWRPTTTTSRTSTSQQNHSGAPAPSTTGCRRCRRRRAGGRRPGRASCRGPTPGRSGGRRSRRPSRWRRAAPSSSGGRERWSSRRTAATGTPGRHSRRTQRDDVRDREDPARRRRLGRLRSPGAAYGSASEPGATIRADRQADRTVEEPPCPRSSPASSTASCPGRFVWRDDRCVGLPVDHPARSRATRSSCRSPRSTTGSTSPPDARRPPDARWPTRIGRAQQAGLRARTGSA